MQINGGDIATVAAELGRLAGEVPSVAVIDIADCGSSSVAAEAERLSWVITEQLAGIAGDLIGLSHGATHAQQTLEAADQQLATIL